MGPTQLDQPPPIPKTTGGETIAEGRAVGKRIGSGEAGERENPPGMVRDKPVVNNGIFPANPNLINLNKLMMLLISCVISYVWMFPAELLIPTSKHQSP